MTGLVSAMHSGMSNEARVTTMSKTNQVFSLFGDWLQRHYGNMFYAKGQNLARTLTSAYDTALETHTVLLMPTTPNFATPIPSATDATTSSATYFGSALNMIDNTAPFNVTGHPACTVPLCPKSHPDVGLMIVGRKGDDHTVLKIASALEQCIKQL